MRTIIKKILLAAPRPVRVCTVYTREFIFSFFCILWEKIAYPHLPKDIPFKTKNILIYNGDGALHSGTGKRLQLIANTLCDTHTVHFMYSAQSNTQKRTNTLDPRIIQIEFNFSKIETNVPRRIFNMDPHIKEIIAKYKISYLVVLGPGYAQYPWCTIKNIPIMLCTSFGAPSLQKNLAAVVYNSKTTQLHAEKWVGARNKRHTYYTPLSAWPENNTPELGLKLRKKLHISESSFVFGRIGRDDNNIYDPIGIKAFEKLQASGTKDVHYIIMSPPPLLVEYVHSNNIPNIHLIPPSGKEEDIWAFHAALDSFAHFRRDGETSGVAIAESLAVGNPVISHKSIHWNSHLEYLDPAFSRIADIDNSDAYFEHMKEYVHIARNEKAQWNEMKKNAIVTAETNFSPKEYGKKMLAIIQKSTESI